MEIVTQIVDVFEKFFNFVITHLPFFAVGFLMTFITQGMKNLFFTREAVLRAKGKSRKIYYWARKTLPLHPVILGMLLGLVWHDPEPGVDTTVKAMGYFAGSGIISVWFFNLARQFVKSKYNTDILPEELDEVDSVRPPEGVEGPAPTKPVSLPPPQHHFDTLAALDDEFDNRPTLPPEPLKDPRDEEESKG